MAKEAVSHRLDGELMAWATSYAKARGSTRSLVIEEALRSLRADAECGVPDLPAVPVESVPAPHAPSPHHELHMPDTDIHAVLLDVDREIGGAAVGLDPNG